MRFALYLATRTMDGNFMLAVKPTIIVVGERADAWKTACKQQGYFDPAVAFITIFEARVNPAAAGARAIGDSQLGWY